MVVLACYRANKAYREGSFMSNNKKLSFTDRLSRRLTGELPPLPAEDSIHDEQTLRKESSLSPDQPSQPSQHHNLYHHHNRHRLGRWWPLLKIPLLKKSPRRMSSRQLSTKRPDNTTTGPRNRNRDRLPA